MSDERAQQLRSAFDAAFAAPAEDAPAVEDFLAVTVGGERHAFRVRDVARIAVDRRIVPVPSRRVELLGLVGLRGSVVPVYSLARLLGHPAGDAPPRWLACWGRRLDVAFAFEALERHLRVPAGHVSIAGAAGPRRTYVDELVRDGALVRGIVDLAAVARAVTSDAAAPERTPR